MMSPLRSHLQTEPSQIPQHLLAAPSSKPCTAPLPFAGHAPYLKGGDFPPQ